MSLCSFCTKDGGEKGCHMVSNGKVIEFVCEEFNIDLSKTFGFGVNTVNPPAGVPEPGKTSQKNQLSFIVYLCPECFKQFEEIVTIFMDIDSLKAKLDKVLSEVRNIILSAASHKNSPAQDSESTSQNQRLSKNGETGGARLEISPSDDNESSTCTSAGFGVANPGIGTRGPHTYGRKNGLETEKDKGSVIKAVDHVQIKTESIGSTYEEEDVEEFNDLIPTGEIASSQMELDSFMEDDNEKSNNPSHLIANAGPKKIPGNTISSQDQLPLLHDHNYFQHPEIMFDQKCQLCHYRGRRFKDMHSLRSHIRISHESAPLLYNCPKENCEKKFPVEILLKKHILFHEEESTKMFGCLDCDDRFDSGSKWNRHVRWHEKLVSGALQKKKKQINQTSKLVPLQKIKKPTNRTSVASFKKETHENRKLRKKIAIKMHCKIRCRFCNKISTSPKNIRNHEVEQHQDKLVHSCHSCDQKYSSALILETHVETHSASINYQCKICEIACEAGHELEDHLVTCHIPLYPLTFPTVIKCIETKCSICEIIYSTNTQLVLHMKEAHGIKKLYECEVCPEKKFQDLAGCLKHILKHHEETGEKALSCIKCSKEFATNFMLQRHYKTHTLFADGTVKLSCDICESIFKQDDLTGLEKHKQLVHGNGKQHRFKCTATDCGQYFPANSFARLHENKCHPELFIYGCKLCDQVYSIECFLETHIRTHTDSRPNDSEEAYGCKVCGRQCSSASTLADHFIRHTGELKYQCPKCPKKFHLRSEIKIHMIRAHQETKPFVCKVCKKGFATKYNLNLHKEIHEDEVELLIRDPKTCRDCGLKFPTTSRLRTHISSKHRIKQPAVSKMCEFCGKVLKSRKTLMSHMLIHEVDKKHVCYFCNKRFSRNFLLNTHLRIHTKERPHICYICHIDFRSPNLTKHLNDVHKKDGTYFPKPDSDPQLIS